MLEKVGGAIWKSLSRFILAVTERILRLFGKTLDEKQQEAFLQFCKFAIVGVTNTLLSWLINVTVLRILTSAGLLQEYHLDVYTANIVAFILSVLWSFYWNDRYVFKQEEGEEKRVWWKALLKAYAAYAFTGLFLSNVISYITVDRLGINKYIAPLINLVISVPVNFLLNKFWAFSKKGAAKPEETAKEQTNVEENS